MNSLERIINAINFEEIDHVPVIPQLTYAAAKWMNKTVTDGSDNLNLQYESLAHAYKECRFDGIYAGWEGSFNLLANAMGAELKYSDENPPSVAVPPVKNQEDLELIIEKNRNSGIKFMKTEGIEINIELIKKLKSNFKEVAILSYLPAPFTYVGVITGVTQLMLNVIRKPDFIKTAMDLAYDFILHFGKLKIDAGADCITIADPSSSSTMISPDNFKELGYPMLKKLITDLKKHSKEIMIGVHICGNTKPILDLLENLDIEFFELDSLVPISDARNSLKNTCIVGNIAPADLTQKSSHELRELYDECLKNINGTGYILSSGCEIAYGTPIENLKEMVLASKNYHI